MAGSLIATLPIGGILGRVTTRRTFGAFLTIIGFGLFVVSVQNSFTGLVVVLFLLGIPRAGLVPMVNRVISENYDRNKRGMITGFLFAAVPLGGFFGAMALPALSEVLQWNAGYGLLAIFALTGGITSWFLLPKDGTPMPSGRLKAELKSLGSKAFIVLSITYGLFALSLSAEAFVTLYLVDVVKISALAAGAFFGLIQLTGIGGRVFWGILADRFFSKNRWWLLAFTNGLTVISFALLIQLTNGSPYWMISLTMVGFGVSAASSWGILSTLVGDVVEVSSVAVATAFIFFITTIADSGGPVLFSTALRLTRSYQSTISIYMYVAVMTTLAFALVAVRNHFRLKTYQ